MTFDPDKRPSERVQEVIALLNYPTGDEMTPQLWAVLVILDEQHAELVRLRNEGK